MFNHPLNVINEEKKFVRLRDEGFRVTITYKYKDKKSQFKIEDEIVIDNFDTGIKILLDLGCTQAYYYETIREIWILNNSEIIFDTAPAHIDRMEIECENKENLDIITKKLELTENILISIYNPLIELFGIKLDTNINIDLTFLTVKKVLGKYVTKNKTKFDKMIKEQLMLYNKLIKN